MKLRIAVADDESAILNRVATWLADLGHVPVRAYGGAELVRVCLIEPPDLAISDADLPGVNGFKAAESIRRGSAVPVVLMSGRWDAARLGHAANLGVSCIAKSLTPGELAQAIEDAVAAGVLGIP